MSTALSHGVVALALGRSCVPAPVTARFWLLALLCSAGPDLDVFTRAFGAEHGSLWAHRGITHSLPFAVLVGVAVVTLGFRREAPWPGRRWWGYTTFFVLLTASHGLIDACTDGGPGVALLAPFSGGRWFLPWRPLVVPPIGLAPMFSRWGLEVLVTEAVWIWIPAAGLAALVTIGRRLASRPARPCRAPGR
jgi:inner membrane protein